MMQSASNALAELMALRIPTARDDLRRRRLALATGLVGRRMVGPATMRQIGALRRDVEACGPVVSSWVDHVAPDGVTVQVEVVELAD